MSIQDSTLSKTLRSEESFSHTQLNKHSMQVEPVIQTEMEITEVRY